MTVETRMVQPESNKYGYKQQKDKPMRDMGIGWHGCCGIDSLVKMFGKERITSSFHSVNESNTIHDSDGFKWTDKIFGSIGLWRDALYKAGKEVWEYALKRIRKIGVLFLSHPRGDGKNKIYQPVPGFPGHWTYHDEYWTAEDYIKPLYLAYLSFGYKKVKSIPYKGIMEKKYSPKPEPKPIIIIEENTEEIKFPGEEKEDKMDFSIKELFEASLIKHKWYWISGFIVLGIILGIVIF